MKIKNNKGRPTIPASKTEVTRLWKVLESTVKKQHRIAESIAALAEKLNKLEKSL